jgi:hypothetical protein
VRVVALRRPLADGDEVSIRLGSLDGDPGIRPQYHSFVDSRAAGTSSPRTAASIRWGSMTRDDVIEALRSVEDPELGMDIVELGLLYDAEVEGPRVKVLYSLTSIGCPAGPLIQQNIEKSCARFPESRTSRPS